MCGFSKKCIVTVILLFSLVNQFTNKSTDSPFILSNLVTLFIFSLKLKKSLFFELI